MLAAEETSFALSFGVGALLIAAAVVIWEVARRACAHAGALAKATVAATRAAKATTPP